MLDPYPNRWNNPPHRTGFDNKRQRTVSATAPTRDRQQLRTAQARTIELALANAPAD
ncbi:MAG TPA: hypothetical protein VJT09_05155 [Pyrinomonadaceae bacterium]|nr:hypothetical protein [Pyrinomonadaceae bacterium]